MLGISTQKLITSAVIRNTESKHFKIKQLERSCVDTSISESHPPCQALPTTWASPMRAIRRFTCVCFLGVSVAVLTSGCSSSSGRKSAKPEEAKAETERRCFPAQKLFSVTVGGKVGFIDRTGKLVITPQFDEAMGFVDGLSWVCLG